MLYRPLLLAVRSSVRPVTAQRALATTPFPEGNGDMLGNLLGEPEGSSDKPSTTAPLWGRPNSNAPAFPFAETDADFPHPPIAPEGSLPAGSAPAPRKAKDKGGAHKLPEVQIYHLHVHASRNNTILTLTNSEHKTQGWVSAGLCGFKNVQRSGYEAAYQCAVRIFARIAELRSMSSNPFKLELVFNGYGAGREAVFRALMATEGDQVRETVYQVRDSTPIKIGGTKAKKARRL